MKLLTDRAPGDSGVAFDRFGRVEGREPLALPLPDFDAGHLGLAAHDLGEARTSVVLFLKVIMRLYFLRFIVPLRFLASSPFRCSNI